MACVHTVSRNISYTDSGECEYTAKKYFNNAHIGGLKKYIFLPQQIMCSCLGKYVWLTMEMNVQTNLSWLLFEKVLESNRDKVYLIHKVLHKTKWKQNNVVKENFGKTVKNWCSHFLSLSFKHMRTWLFIFAGTSQGPLPLDIWLTYWILFATAYWKKPNKAFQKKKACSHCKSLYHF